MLNTICGLVRLFTGVQSRWAGVEPTPVQRIYFANHTSHFDCLVLLSVLPRPLRQLVRPAAAADYWTTNPLRNWFSQNVLHIVPVERHNLTRANNPIKKLIGAIDEGSSLLIFPEGGRCESGEISEFKAGLYHLSKSRPDVELVPTYIDNASRVLPKGCMIPIPLLCTVTFGAPLKLLEGESKQAFLLRAQEAVVSCGV
jgi:1-acyl-sn-glycerol-3-phosphate acyltransferase